MTESEIVWKPRKELVENSNIKRFMNKHDIETYEELYILIFSGYEPEALASRISDCQAKAQEDIVV